MKDKENKTNPRYIIENEVNEISKLLGISSVLPNFGKNQNIVQPQKKIDCTLYCGNNLNILWSLCNSHPNMIDACYIDPPYNTSNKFIYNDFRKSSHGDRCGSHSEWMSFMLPRLIMAKILLKENGIISISIDDYEQPYLRILMDKVFGEENFIGNLVIVRSKNGRGSSKNIAVGHEYIVIYGKSSLAYINGLSENEECYTKRDKHGSYKIDGLFRKKGDDSKREDRPRLFYPLYYDNEGNVYTDKIRPGLKEVLPIDSKGVERRWLWSKQKAERESWKLYASKNGVIYVKNYYQPEKRIKLRTIWDDNGYLTDRATREIKRIYGEKIFETPKPLKLIEDLLYSHTSKDSIIIDFFAGTGTTAHAVNNINRRDNGKRKVILIEEKSRIRHDHIAARMNYKYISDITRKRLEYIKKEYENYSYTCLC